jgi:hypothetical protein
MKHDGGACPRWLAGAALAAALLYALLTLFDVFFVPVEKDEGFYVYAFRLVAEGKLPYRDFSYIESPALPYYYALLLRPVGITMLSVRCLGALTGLAGLLLLVRCAARSAGRTAGAVAALLLFANPAQAEWFARDVTYPLITLLLALAIASEISSWTARSRTMVQGALLAFAGAAKASMGLVSLAWMAGILWQRRRDRSSVLPGAAAFLATLAVSAGWLFLADPKAFLFNVVTLPLERTRLYPFMHSSHALNQVLEFGWAQRILGARTVLLWHLPAAGLAGLALAGRRREPSRSGGLLREATFPIASSLLLGLAAHMLVPSPAYPNYQFLLLPALTLVIVLFYFHRRGGASIEAESPWILGIPVLLCAFNLMQGLDPDAAGLSVGTWRHGPQREMARLAERIVPREGLLLTDYLPAAVDADRRVVPGNEGGRNSLIPDLPDETARAFHILNRKSFVGALRDGSAQAVILTGLTTDSFASVPGFVEEVEAALSGNYELVREFPPGVYFRYGRIRVFRLRSAAAASSLSGPADPASVASPPSGEGLKRGGISGPPSPGRFPPGRGREAGP